MRFAYLLICALLNVTAVGCEVQIVGDEVIKTHITLDMHDGVHVIPDQADLIRLNGSVTAYKVFISRPETLVMRLHVWRPYSSDFKNVLYYYVGGSNWTTFPQAGYHEVQLSSEEYIYTKFGDVISWEGPDIHVIDNDCSDQSHFYRHFDFASFGDPIVNHLYYFTIHNICFNMSLQARIESFDQEIPSVLYDSVKAFLP